MSLANRIITFVFLCLVCIACLEKTCKDYKEVLVDQVSLDYFGMYKPGSYWVYQNQDSTKKDSLYVEFYKRDMITKGTKSPLCYKNESIDVDLRLISKNLTKQDSSMVSSFLTIVEGYIGVGGQSTPYFLGGMRNFYTIYSNGVEELRVNSGEANRLSSIKLNNQTYNGVIFELEDKNISYIKKYIGVIGWKTDNDTFNLIRYNIVP